MAYKYFHKKFAVTWANKYTTYKQTLTNSKIHQINYINQLLRKSKNIRRTFKVTMSCRTK